MRAHIYLHPANFAYNGSDDLASVQNKFHALLSDMKRIVYSPMHNQENKFVALENMHEVVVYPEKTLYPFLEDNISVDDRSVFWAILSNTAEGIHSNAVTVEELSAQCVYNTVEKYPTTMMVVNASPQIDEGHTKPYMQFDNYQIVYGYNSWETFRRQILGNHPGNDPVVFMEECKKYFPNLLFHENCTNSIIYKEFDCINTCPRKIVYYLSCLNDRYRLICKEYHDLGKKNEPNDILADFSGRYGFDRAASIQGKPDSKSSRTFTFKHSDNKVEIEVLCDLHFKITSPDTGYRGKVCDQYNPRIYFSIRPNEDYSAAEIFVGSIGEHL